MWLGCSVYDERHDESHGRNKQQSTKQVHGEGPIDHTLHPSLLGKGPPKKKSVTPVVGGWVKVRKRTRVRFIFSIFFYRVFELPSSRNAQKRDKKKIEKKSVLDFWSNFL